MKIGKVIKSVDTLVTDEELSLINKYTRRTLSKDEVYVFSVVLCDNDVDRDFERFTVESLFELEKLFVGKTGIFDHENSATNQTARIFSTKVESVPDKKTITGDDYFQLVCKAYMPFTEKNKDLIMSIDSGITKEVSVGCAVKENVCSICSNDIYSANCHHTKGQSYNGKLCYSELCSVFDAYEFSFVAVPAQKNAGVIKAFSENKRENLNMKEIISALKKGKQMTLDDTQSKSLFQYITELEKQALDGELYKEQLKCDVVKHMGVANPDLHIDTIKSIAQKLSVSELRELCDAYKSKEYDASPMTLQLHCDKKSHKNPKTMRNQFTI